MIETHISVKKTLPRTLVMFGIILLIAAIGGVWVAGAQGTISNDDDDEEDSVSAVNFCALTPVDNQAVGPEGTLSCGMFEICGHGPYVIPVSDYPDCSPQTDLTVYCLTEDGEWTDREVYDPSQSADGSLVSFTSGQHGICALFPTAGAAPLQNGVISGE